MMFRKIMALTLGAVMLASVSFADSAITIRIDNKPVALEVSPTVENGRTLVPFRAIFEALGLQVDWNEELRIATAYNDAMNVSVKLDSGYGSVNGELKPLEASAKIVKDRTLVPLRFVSEAFGNEVSWDAKKRLVSIKSGFKPYVYTEALPVVGSYEKLKLILDYAGKFNQPVYRIMDGIAPMPAAMEKSAAVADTANAAPAHSTTNIQVAGVDEADIVKTDGHYIYQLRANDLKITKASEGALKAAATLSFENGMYPSELYLYGNKLVVIGSKQSYMPYQVPMQNVKSIMPMSSPMTQLLFYDVANPEKPTLIRKYEAEGNYLTSRLTGGKLYLIANKWLNTYNASAETTVPHFTDSVTGKTTSVGFDAIRYFPDTVESNLMVTLGFNLDQPKNEPDKGVYLGSSNNVYANTDSLVVAMDRYHYRVGEIVNGFVPPAYTKTTELFKFALSNGAIRFKAKGSVPGTVLNQFSMDAYNGNYRIATTDDSWLNGDNATKNNLYVLDGSMNVKGKLEGLAPGERIYSARFIGNRAYMVTFKQVDPFYVIDLSDSTSPKVLGYLKIPGFSDYLHPYDANTVIGFGKDTVETANGAITAGVKIAMFDVSNVANPVEKSRVVLGGSGSWSEVLNNHKALMFSKENNLFALPVTLYEGMGRDNRFAFQGAYVYTIDPAKGFVLKGTSTHLTDAEVRDTELKWYDTSKDVNRILWIGNELYTLSNFGIKSHDLDTMKESSYLKH